MVTQVRCIPQTTPVSSKTFISVTFSKHIHTVVWRQVQTTSLTQLYYVEMSLRELHTTSGWRNSLHKTNSTVAEVAKQWASSMHTGRCRSYSTSQWDHSATCCLRGAFLQRQDSPCHKTSHSSSTCEQSTDTKEQLLSDELPMAWFKKTCPALFKAGEEWLQFCYHQQKFQRKVRVPVKKG